MPFYRRSDVVELKTLIAWRELGFDVIAGNASCSHSAAAARATATSPTSCLAAASATCTGTYTFTAGATPYKKVKRRRRVKSAKGNPKSPATARGESTDDEGLFDAEDEEPVVDPDEVAADGSGDGSETCLYGRWQVQQHVPVPLVDGQVPLNAHGNFELWSR